MKNLNIFSPPTHYFLSMEKQLKISIFCLYRRRSFVSQHYKLPLAHKKTAMHIHSALLCSAQSLGKEKKSLIKSTMESDRERKKKCQHVRALWLLDDFFVYPLEGELCIDDWNCEQRKNLIKVVQI